MPRRRDEKARDEVEEARSRADIGLEARLAPGKRLEHDELGVLERQKTHRRELNDLEIAGAAGA
jgi:hypothetical protein